MTWIKCSDQMPAISVPVLGWRKGWNHVAICHYMPHRLGAPSQWVAVKARFNDDQRGGRCTGPTHWMPMPEMPE